jgi:hypothetical protein
LIAAQFRTNTESGFKKFYAIVANITKTTAMTKPVAKNID